MIEEILTFVIGSGLLIALIGFVARSVFLHYLDRDLATFKESLKTEAIKRQLVFSEVYKRRIDVISDLYRQSVVVGRLVAYVVGMQGAIKDEGEIRKIEERVKAFKESYEENRLWLNEQCCKAMDQLLSQHSISAAAKFHPLLVNEICDERPQPIVAPIA